MRLLVESKLSPGAFIGSLTKLASVISRPHSPSFLTKYAHSLGIVARAAAAGAVVVGFALGANSLHDASLTFQTVSIDKAPVPTDLCTDNPADPSCPPLGPNDAKCADGWRFTAACVGGPFDPNNSVNHRRLLGVATPAVRVRLTRPHTATTITRAALRRHRRLRPRQCRWARLRRHRRRRSNRHLDPRSRQDVWRELVEVYGKGARGDNSLRSRTRR